MGNGPLDHPRLLAIEERLDRGQLDDAQRMLAALGDVAFFRYATTYLATRLLFARRRIDRAAVAQRLRDLLRSSGHFPEAQAMLERAEDGTLEPEVASFKPRRASAPPAPSAADSPPVSQAERLFASHPPQTPELPTIPRAPHLPAITVPPDSTPSYAPSPAPPQASNSGIEFRFQPPIEFDVVEDPAADPELDFSFDEKTPKQFDDPVLEIQFPVEQTRPGLGSTEKAEEPPSSRAPQSPRVPFIRSSRPPPSGPFAAPLGPPSVIELAALLDGQRFEEAIVAIDRAGPQLSPDHVLMRARALQASGRREEARGMLERLGCAPLLDPEVRSGAARVLLELGSHEKAIEQARLAVQDDAEAPLSKITLAWAAVRSARRTSDVLLLGEADSLLSSVKSRAVPMPALVFALRACVQAEIGNAERAVAVAQRALAMDANTLDALAGLAVASARLGRIHDARAAWRRLGEIRPEEAEVLRPRLEELGTDLEQPTAVTVALSERATEQSPWNPVEVALVEGLRPTVISAFESACQRRMAQLIELGNDGEPAAVAEVGAALLTSSPVTHHFAPYDFSLWSIARVDAALELLYGSEPRSVARSELDAPLRLLGAYVGESLRQSYEGRWRRGGPRIDDDRVYTAEAEWRPYHALLGRITTGAPLDLGGAAGAALAHPGAEPWTHRSATPLAPPCLWDPAPWPASDTMPDLAHALSRSVVSRYTELCASGPLDLSMASLASIDVYLALIAPPKAPPPENDTPWVRRTAALIGAYVGETLRGVLGGEWTNASGSRLGEGAYELELESGETLRPVQDVLSRVLGDTKTSIVDYSARVMRRSVQK
jgi:tetratricopeptide (TPR) repeat protein